MKRLFLLDAYALIYRAYYALIRSPRITSGGVNTSAVFGFCNTLIEVLRKEQPTHIAVCFDPKGPTFRHEQYADYKAGREKQPEDITTAIPWIKKLLEAWRIPVIEVPRYEADDVIGTLSRRAQAEGYDTFMMTPDKDYGQLVTDHVFMYRPALRGEGFEVRGPQQVCERYGIRRPDQVIDLLALEGDASDNIPGCPGVGQKTAAKLIAEYDNVDNLLAHAADLKGALGGKIRDNAEQIRFSRILATINTDAPLPPDITPDALVRREPDYDRLTELFLELEFRTLLRRIRPEEEQTPAPAPVDEPPSLFDLPAPADLPLPAIEVTEASTAAEADTLVASLLTESAVGLCVAATGDEAMTATLQGVALATADGRHIYIPAPLGGALKPLLESDVTLVSHDVKRAMVLLRRQGISFAAPYYDTRVAHYLLDPEGMHTLTTLSAKYLHRRSDLLPAADKAWYVTPYTAPRAALEAELALALRTPLDEALAADNLTPLLTDIELPLVAVLADMEYTGVRIDSDELRRLADDATRRIGTLEEEAYTLAGTRFNIGSPSQVGEVLFGRLQLDPKAKRTATGAYSTTEAILEKHADAHPLVPLILNIRKLRKLVTTYLEALPKLVNPATGRIHTTFNQTVTATGRISSTNPNLQNIPIRTDEGREIRRAFIPSPGNILVAADYSQIELRLIAELSHDEHMTEAFLSGADIHRSTAAKVYHTTPEEVTDTQRRNAKTANFGIIYGISAFGLSERLRIPRSEAKALIDGYFAAFPAIRRYLDEAVSRAREAGYAVTAFGRRRALPDLRSANAVVRGYAERNAVNAPIQGTAADIIKRAMVALSRRLAAEGLQSRMTLQVHDELVFDALPDELPRLQAIVAECMAHAWQGTIPLEVNIGTGANWLEAH